MNDTITAAQLLSFRLCTGQCLLGLEPECICRCRGRWHAVLASAEIQVPVTLSLAEALAGGPVGVPKRGLEWAPRMSAPDRDAEARMVLAGQPAVTNRRLALELGVSERTARRIRARLRGAPR